MEMEDYDQFKYGSLTSTTIHNTSKNHFLSHPLHWYHLLNLLDVKEDLYSCSVERGSIMGMCGFNNVVHSTTLCYEAIYQVCERILRYSQPEDDGHSM